MFFYSRIVAAKLQRKPRGAYHHPNLENAMVDAAIKIIGQEGVQALTLRDAAARLGVSRTALYRHFKDKPALLARVALEGFRLFRQTLQSAVDCARANGRDPMEEMGVAYVGFAMANQSHYKTMFGDAVQKCADYPELAVEADAALAVLVNTISTEQKAGRISGADPLPVAVVIWSGIHGLATLAMAGHLDQSTGQNNDLSDLARLQWRMLRNGIAASSRTT